MMQFFGTNFFAKSNLMDVIVFHDIICSFDFLCSLVERAQKLFGIKAFFVLKKWIKAYLQLRMGQPDSWRSWTLWSAKAPNWMSLRMICKNAFNERCYLNCLMWTISLLFRKKWAKATWFSCLLVGSRAVGYHADCELSVSNFFMLTFL